MEESGEEKIFEHQKVNILDLVNELQNLQQENLAKDLVKFKYPCVYIEFLYYHNMKAELNKYIKFCEQYRETKNQQHYYIYCFGFVSPMIRRKKENNQLEYGK